MAQAVDNLTTPARRSFPVCSGDGIEAQATRRSSDDARHMRTLGRRYPNRGTGMKSHGMV